MGGDHPPTTLLKRFEHSVGRPRGCVELSECVRSPLCPCVGWVSPWSHAAGLPLLLALGSGWEQVPVRGTTGRWKRCGGKARGRRRLLEGNAAALGSAESFKCVCARWEEGWGASLVPKPSFRR